MTSSFRRLRVIRRRTGMLCAGGVVAVAVAGCSSFISAPSAGQLAPNGAVEVTSNICLAGFGSDTQPGGLTSDYSSSCSTLTSNPEGAEQGQMLIAYLVPNGSTSPSGLSAPSLGDVTFSASSDYDSWLSTHESTANGYHWAGYISSEFADANPEAVQVAADFAVPAGSGVNPYAGPYVVKQVVIGDRADGPYGDTTLDPSRTLNCSEVVDDVISLPAPASSETVTSASTGCQNDAATSPLSVATRELTSSAPSASTTVQAGNTATIPFTVRFTGPAASAFQLSASTSSNALVPYPVNATFTPSGTGTTIENVSVPVPAELTPGSYTVTLNVGGFGSSAATLNVTAPPAAATTTSTTPIKPKTTPLIAPKLSSVRLRPSTLRLTLRLNIAAAERLTLQRHQGRHWITVKQLALRSSAGGHTLSLRAVFGDNRLQQPGRYRVLIQAFNGSLKSAQRSVVFTIH